MIDKINRASTIAGGVIGSSFTLLFALGGMDVMNYNWKKEGEEEVKNLLILLLKP